MTLAPDLPDAVAGESLVAAAIHDLARRWQDPPALEELAETARLSPAHFQRLFRARVGISPKRFAQHLALTRAKALLARRRSLLEASLGAGLSGPSRLHDLFLAAEAMTPGEYKAAGRALAIRWGIHLSPLGPAVLGITHRGICWLSLGDEEAGIAELHEDWSAATLMRDDAAIAPIARAILSPRPAPRSACGPITVLLRGTNFQMQVWRALLRVQPGAVATYGDVARAIDPEQSASAVRAVAAACGANRVSYLIPCHRVIQSTGALCGYRWGLDHKRTLLALEGATGSSGFTGG